MGSKLLKSVCRNCCKLFCRLCCLLLRKIPFALLRYRMNGGICGIFFSLMPYYLEIFQIIVFFFAYSRFFQRNQYLLLHSVYSAQIGQKNAFFAAFGNYYAVSFGVQHAFVGNRQRLRKHIHAVKQKGSSSGLRG